MPEKCPEAWRAEQRLTGLYGNAVLRNAVLDPTTQTSRETLGAYADYDAFERMGLQYYEAFLAQAGTRGEPSSAVDKTARSKLLESSDVEHGFVVTGRLMGHCVRAFGDFYKEARQRPDEEELKAALLDVRTIAVATELALMPHEVNEHYEENYSLRDGGYRLHNKHMDFSPFLYKTDDGGHFAPHPIFMTQAVIFAPYVSVNDAKTNICPAYKVLVPRLWASMAESITDNPEQFIKAPEAEPLASA